MRFFTILVGFSLLMLGIVWAEDDCSDCSGEGRYSQAAAILERAGLNPENYDVLVSWEERTRDGSGRYVNGFRVKSRTGGDPFDLYIGDDFRVLTDTDLQLLGIPQKKWDIKQVVETRSEPAKGFMRWTRDLPKPRVFNKPATSRLELPPLDMEQIAFEDEQMRKQGKPKRTGVFQDIVPAIEVTGEAATDGVWEPTDEGYVWTVSIAAPEAKGQRVHFASLELPESAYVLVFNLKKPDEVYGPYAGKDMTGPDGFWAPTCFSDEVGIQCFVPRDASNNDIHLVIDKIVHLYVGLEELYWGKAAGWCNLDVTCYPEWETEAKGVAGIGSIGYSGSLWCTGALINDLDPTTQKPFFLTANHCVGNQSEASSIEVYWLYQTSTCNGTAPGPCTVPRTTGGATYMAGVNYIEGNDFTLLKLRNSPQADVVFLGWTTASPQVGRNIVPIHHPSGDFKRISFGYISAIERNFIETRYNQGTTEPGSSGCPVFDANSKQIIGQLWGGDASCSNLSGYDKYGRFDKTYPVIAQILEGSDDIPSPPVCGSLKSFGDLDEYLSGTKDLSFLSSKSPADLSFMLTIMVWLVIWGMRRRKNCLKVE